MSSLRKAYHRMPQFLKFKPLKPLKPILKPNGTHLAEIYVVIYDSLHIKTGSEVGSSGLK